MSKKSKDKSQSQNESQGNSKNKIPKNPIHYKKHDEFVKSFLEQPIAAREFIEEYVPSTLKKKINFDSIKIENNSFIENELKSSSSDIIYSCKTKDNKDLYCYVLLEAQSTNDQSIAFRLLHYTLSLLKKHVHRDKKNSLPLVVPLVIYNGSKKYTAPRSLWEMFGEPELAKTLLGGEHLLINLQSMSNDEIERDKHISIMKFMMKHAHRRDRFTVLKELMNHVADDILKLDKKNEYVYLSPTLWYIISVIDNDQKKEFRDFIYDKLEEEPDDIMYSIADGMIDELKGRFIEQGIEQGAKRTAINFIKEGTSLEVVSKCTELSLSQLKELQKSINKSAIIKS